MADNTDEAGARAFEMTLEIDASPEAVWRALTDAGELVRWFPLEADEAASRLLSPRGLLAAGTIAGLAEGDAYMMRTAEGEVLDGTVLVHQPPRHFAEIVHGLDDGVIRYEIEGPFAVVMLSLWGDRAADARAFNERWTRRLAALV